MKGPGMHWAREQVSPLVPCARSPVATGGRRLGRKSSSTCSNTPGNAGCSTRGADSLPTPPPPCLAHRPSGSGAPTSATRGRSLYSAAVLADLSDPTQSPQSAMLPPPTTRGEASVLAGPAPNHLPWGPAQNSDGHPSAEAPLTTPQRTARLWPLCRVTGPLFGVQRSLLEALFGDDSPGVKAVGGGSAHTELGELGDLYSSHNGEGKAQLGRRVCLNEESLKTP